MNQRLLYYAASFLLSKADIFRDKICPKDSPSKKQYFECATQTDMECIDKIMFREIHLDCG